MVYLMLREVHWPRCSVSAQSNVILGLRKREVWRVADPPGICFSVRRGRFCRPRRTEKSICGEGCTFPIPLCLRIYAKAMVPCWGRLKLLRTSVPNIRENPAGATAMASEIGVGLIGYGAIGRLHALCYRMLPLAYPDLPLMPRLVAVATASPASAERARRELGDLAATTNFERLLDNPRVALVDCCAPTGDHARIATATLL